MCTGIEWLLLAGAAVGTVATVQQGQQAEERADKQAALVAQQGAQELDAAKARAEKIRRMGNATRGEAKAALAASGVKLGEGTPLEIDQTIAQRSEEDALTEILSGKRKNESAGLQSQLLREAGSAAKEQSYLSAASTALGSYGSYVKSGWRAKATGSDLAV